MGALERIAIPIASDVRESRTICLSPSENVSSEENMPSSNLYMNTSLSLTPNAWAKLTKRSWVMGRGGMMFSILIAMDWASVAPITTGIRYGPSIWASMSA